MQNTNARAQQITALLANNSTTFAQVVYATQVKTAAAFKHLNITKTVSANVQLFSNIKAFTSVYANAVKRSAANVASNNAANVQAFTAQQNYYTHNANCYSLVQHNTNSNMYLYCIYNNVQSSAYAIDGVAATKQQVAQYLTKSAAKQLLNNDGTTRNATHNVTHSVTVRTIALSNLISITANKQTLVF